MHLAVSRREHRLSFALCRRWRFLASLGVAVVVGGLDAAETPPGGKPPRTEFMPATELAPFVVKGERLSVSILARSKADRRYAENFAEDVLEVIYATLEKSAGAGLVIIGEEGEPHPVFVFRKFVEMGRAGQVHPSVAPRAEEASALMRSWEERMNLDAAAKDGLPMESLINALPLPLEGVASNLYQVAWAEGFDAQRVEAKLQALTAGDLASDELSRFDWVFYLPPRDAFRDVMKAAVPTMLKKSKMGFFKRTAVRGAMVAFAPAIRKAVEAMRKGMLYMTVMRARSGYSMDDVQQLTRAYVRVLMPDFKFNDGSTQQRAIEAIEKQKIANAEYAKDPYVSPPRLAEFDAAAYASFEGAYAENPEKKELTHRFARSDEGFTWQYREQKPRRFFPAGDRLLVSENGRMTIEFLVDDTGVVTGVEERSHRRRRTLPRSPAVSLAPTPPNTPAGSG